MLKQRRALLGERRVEWRTDVFDLFEQRFELLSDSKVAREREVEVGQTCIYTSSTTMAESTNPSKTSRTPEEKAAREARKASKKSAAAVDNEAGPSGSATAPVDKQPKGVNAEDYEIDLAAPEPLSKAELRAARRAAKRGDVAPAEGEKPKKRKRLPEFDPNEADEDEKPKGGVAEGAGREVKKQNSVWVGNLAFKTTPQSLREWFERKLEEAGAGGEGSVTRVNLPKKAGKGGFGESKG
jgi:hypothetical protein